MANSNDQTSRGLDLVGGDGAATHFSQNRDKPYLITNYVYNGYVDVLDFNSMETNLKGVFAAGDIVRGASLVVWAIKDGRDAAEAMKKYLEEIEIKKSKVA